VGSWTVQYFQQEILKNDICQKTKVLYCTVLYSTRLHCTALYNTVLHCTVLSCAGV